MKKQETLSGIFFTGIFKKNPTFVQFLGLCPTLAVTSTVENSLGMGVGTLFVLVMSNLIISLVRNYVPDEVRIPVYIVIIAALVTVLEMFMNAYVPELAASLGTFLKLIVVNCIILGRAEAFAAKNGPLKSLADGFGMGIGFTLGITLIGVFREVFGSGAILGYQFIPEQYQLSILSGPAGAFLVFGLLVGQILKIQKRRADKLEKAEVTI